MPKKILIVDDSKMVRDLLSITVRSAGYDCAGAESGIEALEEMAKSNFDLALVDLNMPRMDGYTLIRRIRSDEAWKDIKIIIITTEEEARDMEKGYEAGANLYLVKPIEEDELNAHIQMLIGGPR